MRKRLALTILAAVCAAAPLRAEVSDAAPGGFTIVHEITVDALRGDVWKAAVNDVGRWWQGDHTMSGDANSMSIDARPLGCFCEALPGGGVVHMTVTFVGAGSMLRLTGGLGPLGLMGVDGNMTWEFFDVEGGTRVRFQYAVGGYRPGGLDAIAAAVDGVIGDALQRLARYAETGDPENGG